MSENKQLKVVDRSGIVRGWVHLGRLPGGLGEFFLEYSGRNAGGLIGLLTYLSQSPLDDETMYLVMQIRSICQKWPEGRVEVYEDADV